MRKTFLLGVMPIVVALSALADDWGRYQNPRFAYSIDVPPGFSAVAQADSGDGGISRSRDGSAELTVWGGYLASGDFATEVADRVRADVDAGWSIGYDHRRDASASWSGSLGPRVFYARAIKGCDDATISFRIEYDVMDLKSYHPIVDRLVETFRPTC